MGRWQGYRLTQAQLHSTALDQGRDTAPGRSQEWDEAAELGGCQERPPHPRQVDRERPHPQRRSWQPPWVHRQAGISLAPMDASAQQRGTLRFQLQAPTWVPWGQGSDGAAKAMGLAGPTGLGVPRNLHFTSGGLGRSPGGDAGLGCSPTQRGQGPLPPSQVLAPLIQAGQARWLLSETHRPMVQ